jgi:hypothetical protein
VVLGFGLEKKTHAWFQREWARSNDLGIGQQSFAITIMIGKAVADAFLFAYVFRHKRLCAAVCEN